MERHCPVCGAVMARNDIVCPNCRQRIYAREPEFREHALVTWGRALMFLLGGFFFLKGAYGALSPEDYQRTVTAMGLPAKDTAATSLNAAFFLATGLLYGIAWIGSFSRRAWDSMVCLIALIVFLGGEAVIQFHLVAEKGGTARAVALFIFWVSVPILQYVMYVLGRRDAEVGAEARQVAETGGSAE